MVKEILNNEEFVSLVKSGKKVLVDMWAPWCGPCRMLGPIIEEVSNKVDDTIFVKVNVDELGDIAQTFDVNSIPTLLVFDKGNLVNRSVGYIPEKMVLDLLKK